MQTEKEKSSIFKSFQEEFKEKSLTGKGEEEEKTSSRKLH